MAVDIYRFWSEVGLNDFVHPADKNVLSYLKGHHPFDLKCLPSCIWGRLRTAPIVLLYLSPGLSRAADRAAAKSPEKRRQYVRRRDGRMPLSASDVHSSGSKWWKSRTKFIGLDVKQINNHVAIFNIGAYHSNSLKDTSLLAALPSSRVSLDWAQSVLFPEAIAGRRIVICMRAARIWGLQAGKAGRRIGKGLYVPVITRGGHMAKKPLRRQIIAAVRKGIELHSK